MQGEPGIFLVVLKLWTLESHGEKCREKDNN